MSSCGSGFLAPWGHGSAFLRCSSRTQKSAPNAAILNGVTAEPQRGQRAQCPRFIRSEQCQLPIREPLFHRLAKLEIERFEVRPFTDPLPERQIGRE